MVKASKNADASKDSPNMSMFKSLKAFMGIVYVHSNRSVWPNYQKNRLKNIAGDETDFINPRFAQNLVL